MGTWAKVLAVFLVGIVLGVSGSAGVVRSENPPAALGQPGRFELELGQWQGHNAYYLLDTTNGAVAMWNSMHEQWDPVTKGVR